jgi:GT2 family glycosyltransferase
MLTKESPNLSIIIVSYNVSELLDICLHTVYEYTKGISFEVIVVDSASADASAEMVAKKYPQVTLIASKVNLGFTKGNNAGMKLATGKHVLYLNPDVELINDSLSLLFQYLEAHGDVGAVGPKLLNTDRTHQNSIGRYTRLSNLWNEYVMRERMDTHGIEHPDYPFDVEFVLGACLLVQGDIARKVGGLDERYFMYQEEADLCMTIHKMGMKVMYVPSIELIHHGSKSATKSVESRQRTFHENRKSQYLFIRKNFSLGSAFLAWLLLLFVCKVKPGRTVS